MKELCFFNKKSGIEMGFPELERINRIELSRGEVSGPVSLKESGYNFTIICLRGVCVLYLDPKKEDLELKKMEALIFEQGSLCSKNLEHDKYYLKNRGEGDVLVLVLRIKA
jgi:hypothetical protein